MKLMNIIENVYFVEFAENFGGYAISVAFAKPKDMIDIDISIIRNKGLHIINKTYI